MKFVEQRLLGWILTMGGLGWAVASWLPLAHGLGTHGQNWDSTGGRFDVVVGLVIAGVGLTLLTDLRTRVSE